jgi:ATP-binding cassette, subfamily B, multidrug efflux pump
MFDTNDFRQFQSRKELVIFIFLSRWPFKLLIVVLALVSSVAGLLVPFYQKHFVETLNIGELAISTGVMFVSLTCLQLTNFLGQREALMCQSDLARFLYAHILNLKSLSTKKTVGEKVALYTTDIPSATMWLEQTIPYFLTTLFPLILTPLFLQKYYDLPYSFSLCTLSLLIVFNIFMARRQSVFFYKFKILAGERMGLVNEWIQNMKSLKILNWISAFENKIILKRKEETINRILMVTNGQIMNSFSASITFWLNLFVLIFILITSTSMTSTIDKSHLLILLWVMGIFLARPLRQLPWLLTMMFDALTSVNRLYDYYKLKNIESVFQTTTQKNNDCVKIKQNEIVGLIGPVGSGKSLLLKSILNESPVSADHLYVASCSYLPQEPFILSATIKDNIALTYDSEASDSVCLKALENSEFDILQDRLPEGLSTSIGERGLNLSGGQKQRLNLSRIFFEPHKLILLDDPFSAVDIGTEQKLIQNMLTLKQSGHSFLVTTQRYSFLNYCDRIIFLNQGKIEFNGTLVELMKIEHLRKFLQ